MQQEEQRPRGSGESPFDVDQWKVSALEGLGLRDGFTKDFLGRTGPSSPHFVPFSEEDPWSLIPQEFAGNYEVVTEEELYDLTDATMHDWILTFPVEVLIHAQRRVPGLTQWWTENQKAGTKMKLILKSHHVLYTSRFSRAPMVPALAIMLEAAEQEAGYMMHAQEDPNADAELPAAEEIEAGVFEASFPSGGAEAWLEMGGDRGGGNGASDEGTAL